MSQRFPRETFADSAQQPNGHDSRADVRGTKLYSATGKTMTGVAEQNFSSAVAESSPEPSLSGMTVPKRIATGPIQMDMSRIACAFALLAVAAGFSIACIAWKMFVPGFRAPSPLFGVLVCLILVASIAGRGDFGAGFLPGGGLRAWIAATALLQTTGAALLVAFLPFVLSRMVTGVSADPFELGGTDSLTLMVWIVACPAVALSALLGVRPMARVVGATLARPRRVLVVGGTEGCGPLIDRLRHAPARSVQVLGVVDCMCRQTTPAEYAGPVHSPDLPVPGQLDTLVGMVQRNEVDTVVVALSGSEADHIRAIVGAVESAPVDVLLVPEMDDADTPTAPVVELAGIPLLRAVDPPLIGWQAFLKRTEDVVVAGAVTLLAAPTIVAIAALVKLTSPGPVFFRQQRVGYKGHVFEALKFRTMYTHLSDASGATQTSRGDRRITPFGGWLRRRSLDELPQLLNVLRGDMSLVGPRPHPIGMTVRGVALEDAAPAYRLRQRVKPGLTGWAQVNGNRGPLHTSEEVRDRVALDVQYIRHWSLALDLKIIWLTIRLTLNDEKAY
jgi:polysaccharide biosynthesis protein PslA